MLLTFTSMTDRELSKLMKVYAESSRENIGYFFPDCKNPDEGLKKVEERFKDFLRDDFFSKPENSYYVWEQDGEWTSAFRLTKLADFYFLEALETAPDHRREGQAGLLFKATVEYLGGRNELVIRDHVSKKNTPSLEFHKKMGFEIEHEEAVNYLPNCTERTNPRCYGMIYRK